MGSAAMFRNAMPLVRLNAHGAYVSECCRELQSNAVLGRYWDMLVRRSFDGRNGSWVPIRTWSGNHPMQLSHKHNVMSEINAI